MDQISFADMDSKVNPFFFIVLGNLGINLGKGVSFLVTTRIRKFKVPPDIYVNGNCL